MKPIFSKYFNQPLHMTLRDFKLVHILSLGALYYWCDLLVHKLISLSHNEASLELVGLYFVNFSALVAMFIKAVHDVRRPYYDGKVNSDTPSD